LRYHPLAARSDLEVHLLVPRRWHEYGASSMPIHPTIPAFRVHVLPILLRVPGR